MSSEINLLSAQKYLKEAKELINNNTIEDVIVKRFNIYLPDIYPSKPWWVNYHSLNAENKLNFRKSGKNGYGFVDALVGLTAIEYEKDLTNSAIFLHGLEQVKDYCAGLLNEGAQSDLIIGVLSDTVRWYAYRISFIASPEGEEIYGKEHITLEEVDSVILDACEQRDAENLCLFLSKYLGREGARILSAKSLVQDLGFDSSFAGTHVNTITSIVDDAFIKNPEYSELVKNLWARFISYLGDGKQHGQFDKDLYIRELYILTLAKCMCANILSAEALNSDELELIGILDGSFFKNRGYQNLVEYDYFGWMNETPYIELFVALAIEIQRDLRAYNFRSIPKEDLFGALMVQLSSKSNRLLLGQEWTPSWLAEKIVKNVHSKFSSNSHPYLLDMCCGSGALIVEVVKNSIVRLESDDSLTDEQFLHLLTHCVTGFDIDPLAVMLSKVAWVIAARDKIELLKANEITIPIYHADSFFVTTPLTEQVINEDDSFYDMALDDKNLNLPVFLLTPEVQTFFEHLLDSIYSLAMSFAKKESSIIAEEQIAKLVYRLLSSVDLKLSEAQIKDTIKFTNDLILALAELQRKGKNGIWNFILKNAYRPALLAGQFDGIISNPPWLALSKIADNPYKSALKDRAEYYNIKPVGPSHLHVELSTLFLLHSIDKYLKPKFAFACIIPDSVMSGHHQNKFREGRFDCNGSDLRFEIDELWKIEKGTFKNEAVVFFGNNSSEDMFKSPVNGAIINASSKANVEFNVVQQGSRSAWTENALSIKKRKGFFIPAIFNQGADIMPRTVVFHELEQGMAGKWNVSEINRQTSPNRYLVQAPKNNKDFKISTGTISNDFVFDVLLSNHLSPFFVHAPAKGILPIERGCDGSWSQVSDFNLAANASSKRIFDSILGELDMNLENFFNKKVNYRNKLSNQNIPSNGFLVMTGAGGDVVCSAYKNLEHLDSSKLIIDQTLYWTIVESEDEAIYLTGLFNSQAINDIIKEFQPRGQFGARHVHTLAFGTTPKFNSSDELHKNVVNKTKQLMKQFFNLSDEVLNKLLDTNYYMPTRRRKIRNELALTTVYSDYENACAELYGLR
ncbi:hypothetical protein J8L70_07005 [Pseudoalteromonas sp. MMG010]|uniref:Eco57I restriction-modification methylase domain-containing protein n=1 Tax=Pseudoalteromonas sp. MMG010 TaxID=2822685 RepID=UPI001B3A2FF6|nr:hypothetical protein [Pseudoalteromonas sp. MMG010]MBQ4832983.1 hypothetical protein [Pseudoalteromonas sp. MMG010]